MHTFTEDYVLDQDGKRVACIVHDAVCRLYYVSVDFEDDSIDGCGDTPEDALNDWLRQTVCELPLTGYLFSTC